MSQRPNDTGLNDKELWSDCIASSVNVIREDFAIRHLFALLAAEPTQGPTRMKETAGHDLADDSGLTDLEAIKLAPIQKEA